MTDLHNRIEKLISYAVENLELDKRDVNYKKNRLLEILEGGEEVTPDMLDAVYGELSLAPSAINAKFNSLCAKDTKAATDWLYNYCVKNDYVKKSVLDKNPRFEAEGLVITINKAKPEFRDPKKAVSGNSVDGGFCKCVICRENEGFGARAKRTLRTVGLTLDGEAWFWQYSPYGYFNEHGIAVNCKHTPMHVDKSTFKKLLDFVDIFPHYFIGCNAPLPRIGGSVLAHDHFQGGGEVLPMHVAKAKKTLLPHEYPSITAEIVDWKGTVLRLVSKNASDLVALCEKVRKAWVDYNNPALGIIAVDEEGAHNAVSPTVVKTQRGYEMSLILRNNVTSTEFPDGVFHAHPEFHVIKKESIGLIEAQGLFILPGRLQEELTEIEKIIEQKKPLPPEYAAFKLVFEETSLLYEKDKSVGVHAAMVKELGSICGRILENTAVFKTTEQFLTFLKGLGFEND